VLLNNINTMADEITTVADEPVDAPVEEPTPAEPTTPTEEPTA
jgi:hypothetical protein